MEGSKNGRSYPVRIRQPGEFLTSSEIISAQAVSTDDRGWHVDVVGPLGHYRMSCSEARELAHAYWSAANDCEDHREKPPT